MSCYKILYYFIINKYRCYIYKNIEINFLLGNSDLSEDGLKATFFSTNSKKS